MLLSYEDNWCSVSGNAIIEWLRTKHHEVNKQMASRIKIAVSERLQGNMEESYQKLESFLKLAVRVNPGSHYGFERDGSMFKRACFFPSSCLNARKHCKQIVGLDGTHLKGEMNKRGVYLVATTKDFNNHLVVFGIALVPVENYDNWQWFLDHLRVALCGEPFTPVFISDRQKGLLLSVRDIFPRSVHRFCLRHIIGNIAKLGQTLSPQEQTLVFKMAQAECENDFDLEMETLAATRPKAVEYLRGIPKEHWVTYAIHEKHEKAATDDDAAPPPNFATYDEVTSNMSESANNWIGNDCRSAKPLHAFEDYMMKVVRQFALRRREAERGMGVGSGADDDSGDEVSRYVGSGDYLPLVPFYAAKLEEILQLVKTSEVLPCFVDVVMVRFTEARAASGSNHSWRAVNLKERECTCRKWQDSRFPCVHAVQAAIRIGTHISLLFDANQFSVETFKRTYSYQFVPVSRTATLERDETLTVPPVMIQAEEVGKRGRKPGPKPKHKRRNPKVGSAAHPSVALTQ